MKNNTTLTLPVAEPPVIKFEPDCYAIFTRYFEGYRFHEIAKQLKIPVKEVKKQIKTARQILRDNLKTYEATCKKAG